MNKLFAVILSILLASSSFAAELTSYQKTKFLGLNTRLSPKVIPDDASPDLSNITLEETGAVRDRDVFSQYNSIPGALGNNYITGLFKLYTQTGKYFVACAGSKIASGSNGVWTDITNASISPVPSYYWSTVSFNNNLYLFNLSVPMQKWTGTGLTTTPADYPTTNCAFGAVHKARVWAARSSSVPYRLYMSAINDAESWTDYVDLPDITQTITGLISFGGYLYIFTETDIYVLLGSTPNNFALQKSNSSVGAIAPRSIKVTDKGIMFLSRSGVFAFDGSMSRKQSDNIENTILNISPTNIQNACAVYDGQSKYWLSYTEKGSSYNNRIVIFDQTLNEWYTFNNLNISYFLRAFGGTDKGELYGGSSLPNGIVYSLQSAGGTESITHQTESDFNAGVTFNSVVKATPSVDIEPLIYEDKYSTEYILLSHFDNSLRDEMGHTITGFGGAASSSTKYKYGNYSLYLDGVDDYLESSGIDYAMGTEDFTWEFWFNRDSINEYASLVGYSSSNLNAGVLNFLNDNSIYFYHTVDGGVSWECRFTTGALPIKANTWHHFVVERHGADCLIFLDGISQTVTTLNPFTTLTNHGSGIQVGCFINMVAGNRFYFKGYIDELRITRGKAKWLSNFIPPGLHKTFGSLTSSNIAINASSTAALGSITWTSDVSSETEITFTTRTGTTDDTVYFNGWHGWASASSVVFDAATNATVYISSDDTNFKPRAPTSPQTRNILYFEDEDSNSASCVSFTCVAMQCQNDYVDVTIPIKDLSTYDWIGGWIKSPVSGNSVVVYFDENPISASSPAVTVSTVYPNVWEKWYAYIGNIATASRDAIKDIRYKNLGDRGGTLFIGDSYAYDFYDSGDTIISTPNDYIQYRAILGNNGYINTPALNSVTLIYTPMSGTSESALSSYYNTKNIDFGSPQLDKQFLDFLVDVYAVTGTTVYFDYNIDDGAKSGTFTIPISTTGRTVKYKKYFPSSTFGKTLQIKYRHADKDSQVTWRGIETRFRQENFQ